jgi:hypothetical protein
VHLAIPSGQIGKITHAISTRHCIKRAVGKRQKQTIPYPEGDNLLQALLLHLPAADLHHTLRQIHPCNRDRVQLPGEPDSKITCAGGNIENIIMRLLFEELYCPRTPHAVNAESHRPVHKIISRGNGIKHLAHLPGLVARAFAIRGDILDLHSVSES